MKLVDMVRYTRHIQKDMTGTHHERAKQQIFSYKDMAETVAGHVRGEFFRL